MNSRTAALSLDWPDCGRFDDVKIAAVYAVIQE
jgi:hypothetical protein